MELGRWDVDGLLAEMPSSAFSEWMEYSELEPFGQPWDNWLMAVNSWQFACAHSDPKKPRPKFQNYFYEAEQDKALRKQAETRQFFDWLDSKVSH